MQGWIEWIRTRVSIPTVGDFVAGATVGVLLIPQGLAYALLAGGTAASGLTSSVFPMLAYAALTRTKTVSFGPFALVSAIAHASVVEVLKDSHQSEAALLATFTLFTGLALLLLSLLRVGWLMVFISKPTLAGFVAASALVIVGAELPSMGLDWKTQSINVIDVGLGVVTLVILIVVQAVNRRFVPGPIKIPGSMITVILGVLAGHALLQRHHHEEHNVLVVGEIPARLLQWPLELPLVWHLQWQELHALAKGAFLNALITLISTAAVALQLDGSFDAPSDLIAMGVGNLVSAAVGGVVVCGGLSRSVVNCSAGAASQWASVVSALFVGVVVLFFTSVFAPLPLAVLSAIIIHAVLPLCDLYVPLRLLRQHRVDFLSWCAAFALTLAMGIEAGILGATLLALTVNAIQNSNPRVVRLGLLQGSEYRSTERFPMVTIDPRIIICRVDGPLLYLNRISVTSKILAMRMERSSCVATHLVWDWSPCSHLDTSFVEDALVPIVEAFGDHRVFLVAVKEPLRDLLRGTKFKHLVGESHLHWSLPQAVAEATQQATSEGS
jgi:sulfate permease, SulP family